MGFTQELWKLLPPFLRPGGRSEKEKENQQSDMYIFLKVMGDILDEARQKVFYVRRQALVPTSKGNALDEHGRDRQMPRFAGEPDEDYRLRLENAPEFYLMAGTRTGIMNTMKSLGYPDGEFYPLYKEKYVEDPRPEYLGKWSQFVLRLTSPVDRIYSPSRHRILIENINKVKPPEGRLYAVEITARPRTMNTYSGMLARHGKVITLSAPFPDLSASMDLVAGVALVRSSRITLYQEVE